MSKSDENKIIRLYSSGNTIAAIVKATSFPRGVIYGTIKRNKIPLNKKENIVGLKFGHLEVIGLKNQYVSHRKRNILMAECYCHNCGKPMHYVDVSALKRGYTKSCGCARDQYSKITGENNSSYTGFKDIRGAFWTGIKKKAKQRKIPFQITIEDAWAVYIKQNKKCSLSGMDIYFGRHDYKSENTASLDRIDSLRGYTIDNVQWVHKDLNRMKYSMSQKYFVNLCRLVAKNINLKTIEDESQETMSKERQQNIGAMP